MSLLKRLIKIFYLLLYYNYYFINLNDNLKLSVIFLTIYYFIKERNLLIQNAHAK